MSYVLHCHERVDFGVGRGLGRLIDVVDESGTPVEHFELMCAAIDSDVKGESIVQWIEKVESGELDSVEVDGNGWVIHLSKETVFFEGLYGQGEGGAVSLEQFKFAVQTFCYSLLIHRLDQSELALQRSIGLAREKIRDCVS